MTDSKYPGQLDTDVEIPTVDDNITEIGGEAINSLKSAVLNIEETLGINPQGSASDVATRLNTSLNQDGTIKAAALAAVGLATLPIINSMVATNAGIEELKLDLDYGTVWLKTRYDEIYALIISTMSALAVDIGHMIAHTAHPSTYGRHQTSDVDGYVGASYDGYNLQGMVEDLNTRIINHITDFVGAHAASAISFDDTNLPIDASNVQDAISETALYIQGATIIHQDRLHSNGILKSQEAGLNGLNHSYEIVASSALSAVASGDVSVIFSVLPGDFGQITGDDRVDIVVGGINYTRYVDSTDTGTGRIYFHTPLPVSGAATATVYKKTEEFLSPASLNFGIRRNSVASTGGSIIQLVHPAAPFVLGSGIDLRNLSPTVKNIKITWATGVTPDIDAYGLLVALAPNNGAWTIEDLSLVLNEEFADNHYPFISFVYNGELGIAFDEPEETITITAPSANSAWSVLGFSTGDVGYSLTRRFYIDGYEFTSIRKIIDATGTITGGSPSTIQSITTDIIASGLQEPGILRLKNSTGDNGTYVFDQINSSTSLGVESNLTADPSVRIVSYADTFAIDSLSDKSLFELYLDGYNHLGAELFGALRLKYEKTAAAPQDATLFFDVVDVSRNFINSQLRLAYNIVGGEYQVQLGTRGAGVLIGTGGPVVTLLEPDTDIIGYRFVVYDADGINYVEFEVIQDYSTLPTSNSMDIDIYTRASEERYLQIGKILHNKSVYKYQADRRLFGNVGRYDVRDDFIRDYITYPQSLLRGSGIIYGFEMSGAFTSTLSVSGGQAFVNGNIISIASTTFEMPTDLDSSSITLNLYIDENGVLRLERDNYFYSGATVTPSSLEILESKDKLLLATILYAADLYVIALINDCRRFVGRLDDKLDLIVETQNTGSGSFVSIPAAVNYLNLLGDRKSSSRTIRIRGEVEMDVGVVLPENTTLMGDGYGWNSSSILTSNNRITIPGNYSIFMNSGCAIRNLGFYAKSTTTNGIINFNAVTNDVKIENCFFQYGSLNANNNVILGSAAVTNLIVKDCVFQNIDYGLSLSTASSCRVEGNFFTGMRSNCIQIVTVYGCKFINNQMAAVVVNMTPGTAFIQLGYTSGTVELVDIIGNTMLYLGVQAPVVDVAMIDINGASVVTQTVNIRDNYLQNLSSYGFASAILCAPSIGTVGNISICNNSFFYFDSSDSNVIEVDSCPYTTISNNEFSQCKNSILVGTAAYGVSIENNKINAGIGFGISVTSVVGLVMTGNRIETDGSNFGCILSAAVVTSVVENNYFFFNTNSSKALLFQQGSSGNINDNQFVVTGNLTIYPPLVLDGSNNLVSNNYFTVTGTIPDDTMISDNGTGNVDSLNKGQTYYVPIALSKNAMGSDWSASLLDGYGISLTASTVTLFNSSVFVEFDVEDIPLGATLTGIDVRIYSNSGNNLYVAWRQKEWDDSSLSTVSARQYGPSAPAATETISLTPISTTYMTSTTRHIVYVEIMTAVTSVVYGCRVTYVL